MATAAIIGAGAWGTALSLVVRRAGGDAILWAHTPAVADTINARRENPDYLPGVALDPAVRATGDLADTAAADIFLLATPAQHLRGTIAPLAGRVRGSAPMIVCAKGIEAATGALMSEAVAAVLPGNPVMVLSGPTFAAEVAAGLPTAVTLAAADADLAARVASVLGSERFRPYTSSDVTGAQIGGAIKNVLAVACGIAAGRGCGDNARAALITRGLAELTRLCIAKGGRAETMMGLSGLGDLVLTCTSGQSRNYSLGEALGHGGTLAEIMGKRRSVAEGVHTAGVARSTASALGVDMPIVAATDAVLNDGADIGEMIDALLARPFRPETD